MAILRAEVSFNYQPLVQLAQQFPDLSGKWLGYVGKIARRKLKEDYLSGQEIQLDAYPKDSRGRHTIQTDVNRRRNEMKLYSYPVNLFERGRRLRSGKKEKGKYIITKKLKNDINAGLSSYIGTFERDILGTELKDLGLK